MKFSEFLIKVMGIDLSHHEVLLIDAFESDRMTKAIKGHMELVHMIGGNERLESLLGGSEVEQIKHYAVEMEKKKKERPPIPVDEVYKY